MTPAPHLHPSGGSDTASTLQLLVHGPRSAKLEVNKTDHSESSKTRTAELEPTVANRDRDMSILKSKCDALAALRIKDQENISRLIDILVDFVAARTIENIAIEEQAKQHEARVLYLDLMLQDWRNEIIDLRDTIKAKDAEIARLRGTIEELQTADDGKDAQIAILQASVASLELELTRKKAMMVHVKITHEACGSGSEMYEDKAGQVSDSDSVAAQHGCESEFEPLELHNDDEDVESKPESDIMADEA
jgi:chromosome segregation ATPase